MNIKNKLFAVCLSVTTVVWLFGGTFISPTTQTAQAATVEELQAQINQLLAQINSLSAQLGAAQGQPAGAAYNFTKDLTLGSKGADVTALQQFLKDQGAAIYPEGLVTGYFGSLTKAALGRYQAKVGISPTAGYFGPKTRAYVNNLSAGGGTTGGGTTGGTTIPGTGLTVSLASDNPPAGSLVSSASTAASRVEVLKVTMTAGTAGAITVNGIKFNKTGVLSDTAISNAYLVESRKVIGQYSSISGGVITFSSLALSINAGQTRNFTLAIDPSSGLSAGNTVGFALKAASDITAVDTSNAAVTPTGVFPLNSNVLTVTTVSNPALASLTIASSSVGTAIYAGTQNSLVSQWSLSATNSPVKLSSIKFSVIGSAAKTDIQNVKLMINGTQIGSTLTSVGSDGSAYFDLSASPATINTGTSNMQVYADIMGSPSFNFDFGILNSYDVYAIDSTYNTGVAVTVTGGSTGSTSGHQITINQGQITVSAASNTPTGNIAKGGSGTTLAKFTIYAAGEPVKVKYLDFKLTFTGTTGTISSIVKNVALIDDVGGQVGSTISTPPSSNTCAQGTAGYISTSVYGDCFGTSASPINYIVPANTTRVLSLRGDIQTTAAFTTVTAALSGNTSNLQGQTSSQSASSGSASGAALTLATTPLSSIINNAVSTQTYARGATGVKIGSFVLGASSAEGVTVSNLTITMSSSSAQFQNLLVRVGSQQIGTTRATLSGSDAVTFSTPFTVTAGGSSIVDVYADVLSSATIATYTGLTTLTSCTGTGIITNSSVSCSPTSVAGQNVTISSGPTVTVSMDSGTSPNKQVVMGATGVSLATFRFTETSNLEPVKITDLIIRETVSATSSVKAGYTNLTFYKGTSPIGTASLIDGTSVAATYKAVFSFGSPVVVPQNGSVSIELKGDAASYSSGGSTDNATSTFKINASSTDVTALGQSSNTGATVTLSSAGTTGSTLTILRTKLTLSSATLGTASGRTRTAVDNLATLTFNADAGYDVTVNSVVLKFQGMAVSNGTSVAVRLIDPSTGSDWSGTSVQTVTSGAGNSATITFSFTTIPTISAGGSKSVTVRTDSSSFYNATQASDSLTVLVNAATDINWGDGTTTNGLNLEATTVPIVVSSVSYE